MQAVFHFCEIKIPRSALIASKKLTVIRKGDRKVQTKQGGGGTPKRKPNKNKNKQFRQYDNFPSSGAQFKAKDPVMRHTANSVIIKHTEFIGNVPVPANTQNLYFTKYECNPNNQAMFPWLQTVARAYEKYKIIDMSFRYVSSVSTMVDGNVWMYIDYDVTDSDPVNLQMMAQATNCFQMQPVYKNSTLRVTPRLFNQTKSYLVQEPNEVLTSEQKLFYNPFNFFVGNVNYTLLTKSSGFIYCDYTIELMIPTSEHVPTYLALDTITSGVTINAEGFYNVDPSQFRSGDSSVIISSGNANIGLIKNGFIFRQGFSGLVVMSAAARGFDAGRLQLCKPYGGAIIVEQFNELKDISGGTDEWFTYLHLNCKPGDGFVFYGNLTNDSTESLVFRFWCASIEWKWASDVEPTIYPLTWR